MPRKAQELDGEGFVRVTKYENRRLYDRGLAQYITYQSIIDMVRGGQKVRVTDKKTGADLTVHTLLACLSLMHGQEPVFESDYLHSIVKNAPRAKAKAA